MKCKGPCHLAILDPRTQSGTCHREHCFFCKPRACCADHHKHFIVDADAMSGVCVRHTDDCTPSCIKSDVTGKQVCSKGCNTLARLDPNIGSNESPLEKSTSLLGDVE